MLHLLALGALALAPLAQAPEAGWALEATDGELTANLPTAEGVDPLPAEIVVVAGVVVDATGTPVRAAHVEVLEDDARSSVEVWRSLTSRPVNDPHVASQGPLGAPRGSTRSALRTDEEGRFALRARTDALRFRVDADVLTAAGVLRTPTTTQVARGATDLRLVVTASPAVTVDVLLPAGVSAADIGVVLRPLRADDGGRGPAREVVLERTAPATFVARGVPAGAANLLAFDRRSSREWWPGTSLLERLIEVDPLVREQRLAPVDLRDTIAWIGPIEVTSSDGTHLEGARCGVVPDRGHSADFEAVLPANERTWHAAHGRSLLLVAPGHQEVRVPLDARSVSLHPCAVVDVSVEVAPELVGRVDDVAVSMDRAGVGRAIVPTLVSTPSVKLTPGEVSRLEVPGPDRWFVDVTFKLDGVHTRLRHPSFEGGDHVFEVPSAAAPIRRVVHLDEKALAVRPRYPWPGPQPSVSLDPSENRRYLRVLGPDGAPLARCAMFVLRLADGPPFRDAADERRGEDWDSHSTDALGRTELWLGPFEGGARFERVRIVVVAPDGVAYVGTVALPEDASTRLDVPLDALGPPLRARLVDGEGTPISSGAFSVQPGAANARPTLPYALRFVHVADDGTFVLPAFPGVETYELTAFAPQHHAVDRTILARPGDELTIVARRVGAVQGAGRPPD